MVSQIIKAICDADLCATNLQAQRLREGYTVEDLVNPRHTTKRQLKLIMDYLRWRTYTETVRSMLTIRGYEDTYRQASEKGEVRNDADTETA